MPWKASQVVDERVRFIAACAEEDASFAELCRRFGVSRKTGYKWLQRYEQRGPAGLYDEAPRARSHPQQTPPQVLDAVLRARKRHPHWGPRKLRVWLLGQDQSVRWPAASTIGEALKRHGLIRPRRRRPRVPAPNTPIERGSAPNEVWCVDFKGHFALRDRSRCHPLTLSDEASRYVLKIEALQAVRYPAVREHMELAFREFGLPLGMRSDNGPPFASTAVGGLSPLSVWWIRLGIAPLRITPGAPQDNGVHERMHRTLKAEATQPPEHDLPSQQRAFDRFRHEFNDERPHEALAMKAPVRVYTSSPRPMPERLREPEYADEFVTRRCGKTGRFGFGGAHFVLSKMLAGAVIGIRQLDETRHDVFYGPVRLGYFEHSSGKPRFHRA